MLKTLQYILSLSKSSVLFSGKECRVQSEAFILNLVSNSSFSLPDFVLSHDSLAKLVNFLGVRGKTTPNFYLKDRVLKVDFQGKRRLELPTEELEEFLTLSFPEKSLDFDGDSLGRKLGLILASSGKFTGGLYLDFRPTGLLAFSTDAYLLSFAEFPGIKGSGEKIILQDGFSPRLLGEKCQLSLDGNSVLLRSQFSEFTVTAKLARLDKVFLEVSKVLSNAMSLAEEYRFDPLEALPAINSLLTLEEGANQNTFWRCTPEEIFLGVTSESGQSEEFFPCRVAGKPFADFQLRLQYLKKISKLFTDEVTLRTENSSSLLYFSSAGIGCILGKAN